MTRRAISPAEERRILAIPSPLQRETRIALLRGGPGDRIIPDRSAEDRADLRGMRDWLENRPHVAWCKCEGCRAKEAAQ